MSFCCLCLSSLSWGDSRNAGGARYSAGGGGILRLATSSSSSMYESLLYLALNFRPVVLVGSFVDEVSGVGRGESMVTDCG